MILIIILTTVGALTYTRVLLTMIYNYFTKKDLWKGLTTDFIILITSLFTLIIAISVKEYQMSHITPIVHTECCSL